MLDCASGRIIIVSVNVVLYLDLFCHPVDIKKKGLQSVELCLNHLLYLYMLNIYSP